MTTNDQSTEQNNFSYLSKSKPPQHAELYFPALERHLVHHLQACGASFKRLWQNPFATMLTIFVIGISLALPTGLLLFLKNIQGISTGWSQSAQISLFLKIGTSARQAEQMITALKAQNSIQTARYISPQQGLAELEKTVGLNNILSELSHNPLPPVITVTPSLSLLNSQDIHHLVKTLQTLPHVDSAQLNLTWVEKLYAIIDLMRRGIWGLACLLVMGVILVIGNTIRLLTLNHRHEIEVIKLIGATNRFVRRPFLYAGFFYGLGGALVAALLVNGAIQGLASPVATLAKLYHSHYQLTGLDSTTFRGLIIIGIIVGVLGSALAVSRHLRGINPQ